MLSNRLSFLFVLAAISLSGFGCVPQKYSVRTDSAPIQNTVPTDAWQSIAPHAARLIRMSNEQPPSAIILYRFDADAFRWRFANDSTSYGVSEWARRIPEAVFISNGVYFHDDLLPSGFLKINNVRAGTRQFDLDRSGLIVLGSQVRIIDSETETVNFETIADGAQSFPFLIKNEHAVITEESNQSARRTFLGIDVDGSIYLGIVPYRPITLYALARELILFDISWKYVLNLDGGPSSGIASSFPDAPELIDSFTTVPNVLVVEPK